MSELLLNPVEAAAPREISAIDNVSPQPPSANLVMVAHVVRIPVETLDMQPSVEEVLTTIPPYAISNPTKPVLNNAADHGAAVASHHDYQLKSQIAVAATTPADNDSGSTVEMTVPNANEDPQSSGTPQVEPLPNVPAIIKISTWLPCKLPKLRPMVHHAHEERASGQYGIP
jgi:hypothetical protein